MARIVIVGPADADFAEIIADLNRDAGSSVADRYEDEFEALYRRLEAFPKCGSLRPKLGRFVRIGLVLPYIVIYRHLPDDDIVAILRIVHGRRRIARRMLELPPAFSN